ncbi:MAG: C40 family peptidase [Acidimicrobiales bacterium]
MKLGRIVVVGVLAVPMLLVLAVAVIAGALAGVASDAPSPQALGDIPPDYLELFVAASATCPGLSWTIPAAIAKVESDFGRSPLPGVNTATNEAGAAGPMQIGIGGRAGDTFGAYDHPVPADTAPTPAGGETPPSPYNPTDAVYAAVRYLCTNGAGEATTLRQAIWNYNHSDDYVEEVLAIAASYAGPPAGAVGGADAALRFALAQLGTPYRWGGEGDGGFDCSGLVQAAYATAGITMPRTAQAQHDAGPALPSGAELEPGDLVFFANGTDDVTHVGLYLGDGQMIDAPHAGAVVRVEPYRWASYLGATRPALSAPRPIPTP